MLVVGGGEGMGPLKEIARGIASSGMNLQLAVVCGRNETLRQELESISWEIPTHIYGFVTIMPEMMRAADLIVTKAGPSSVMEAVNARSADCVERRAAGARGWQREIYCGRRRGIVGAVAAKSGERDSTIDERRQITR